MVIRLAIGDQSLYDPGVQTHHEDSIRISLEVGYPGKDIYVEFIRIGIAMHMDFIELLTLRKSGDICPAGLTGLQLLALRHDRADSIAKNEAQRLRKIVAYAGFEFATRFAAVGGIRQLPDGIEIVIDQYRQKVSTMAYIRGYLGRGDLQALVESC